ncbi:hypothetical protein BC830DRAFT_557424 [Chytriomyces sp. MP71]|nr:hypothetical protein BC830DRAFT_557424 [Chytriomyces sp. MP71]
MCRNPSFRLLLAASFMLLIPNIPLTFKGEPLISGTMHRKEQGNTGREAAHVRLLLGQDSLNVKKGPINQETRRPIRHGQMWYPRTQQRKINVVTPHERTQRKCKEEEEHGNKDEGDGGETLGVVVGSESSERIPGSVSDSLTNGTPSEGGTYNQIPRYRTFRVHTKLTMFKTIGVIAFEVLSQRPRMADKDGPKPGITLTSVSFCPLLTEKALPTICR